MYIEDPALFARLFASSSVSWIEHNPQSRLRRCPLRLPGSLKPDFPPPIQAEYLFAERRQTCRPPTCSPLDRRSGSIRRAEQVDPSTVLYSGSHSPFAVSYHSIHSVQQRAQLIIPSPLYVWRSETPVGPAAHRRVRQTLRPRELLCPCWSADHQAECTQCLRDGASCVAKQPIATGPSCVHATDYLHPSKNGSSNSSKQVDSSSGISILLRGWQRSQLMGSLSRFRPVEKVESRKRCRDSGGLNTFVVLVSTRKIEARNEIWIESPVSSCTWEYRRPAKVSVLCICNHIDPVRPDECPTGG